MEQNSPNNRRILLVDDDQDIHETIKGILIEDKLAFGDDLASLEQVAFNHSPTGEVAREEMAYRIDSAHQGEVALKMVIQSLEAKDPYAVIFMDMRMPPGWDGLRTIQEIWAVAPETEVVIISAYSDHSWRDLMGLFGATDRLFFLKKPFHTIELQQITNALTTKWNLAQRIRDYQNNLEKVSQSRAKQILAQQSQIIDSEKLASLGRMAGGIAHEINSPLSIILMTAEQIKDQAEGIGRKNSNFGIQLDSLINTTVRIGKITQGLAMFSRDAHADLLKTVELKSIVDDTTIFCEERFKSQKIDLRVRVPDTKIKVECRPAQISQIIVHLFNNAFDAVEKLKERWVEISVIDRDDSVQLRVGNSGPRIPEDILDKIFDPFFTTKEVGKGSGLGLSVSKSLVDGHRGKIFVDLSLPHTEFVVELPKVSPVHLNLKAK